MNSNLLSSQPLRKFKLSLKTAKGTHFNIQYGYSMSAIDSGHYLMVSIDEKPFTQSKKALARVRNLGIAPINMLIDAMGTDVTGAPYGYESRFFGMLNEWKVGTTATSDLLPLITEFLGLTTREQQSDLAKFLNEYSILLDTSKSEAKANQLARKYMNSHRLRMIESSRDLIRQLRSMHKNGIVVDGTLIYPHMYDAVPFYYKRDIDYIRKARVNLFQNVLKRKYVPFV